MNSLTPFPSQEVVAFQRNELNVILSLYGRMVAAGEWRDYGISSLRDVAIFSVFRRTAEHPLYRIQLIRLHVRSYSSPPTCTSIQTGK